MTFRDWTRGCACSGRPKRCRPAARTVLRSPCVIWPIYYKLPRQLRGSWLDHFISQGAQPPECRRRWDRGVGKRQVSLRFFLSGGCKITLFDYAVFDHHRQYGIVNTFRELWSSSFESGQTHTKLSIGFCRAEPAREAVEQGFKAKNKTS